MFWVFYYRFIGKPTLQAAEEFPEISGKQPFPTESCGCFFGFPPIYFKRFIHLKPELRYHLLPYKKPVELLSNFRF